MSARTLKYFKRPVGTTLDNLYNFEPVTMPTSSLGETEDDGMEPSYRARPSHPSPPALSSLARVVSGHNAPSTAAMTTETGRWTHLSYVGGGPLLVLRHAALQVEGEVVAVHQDALAKLLLKLFHVRLDPREVQFLPGVGGKQRALMSGCGGHGDEINILLCALRFPLPACRGPG